MTTPNRENIAKWVAALRSGEYEQNSEASALRVGDTFCCLGVACEVAGIQAEISERNAYSYDGELAYLPASAKNWLGLTKISPFVHKANGETEPLTTINDAGTPFAEIADLIEAEWLS